MGGLAAVKWERPRVVGLETRPFKADLEEK